jgi:sulfur-carrier protein
LIRVVLPAQLRSLAGTGREVQVEVTGPATQRSVIDALEQAYPPLRGTLRDIGSDSRRPLVRFFACEEDLSDEDPDALLPEEVAAGKEPFLIIGAMAGGID